jgi:VanZ family protein
MNIFFSILSAAYIAAIFLLADSPVVNDVATFNPYSLLHIPLYGILTLLLILSFSNQRRKVVNSIDSTNSIDPSNSSNPSDSTNPSNSINPTNSINYFIAGIIALVVAIADEIHQTYLPNRNASIIDVFLDVIGIILCIALIARVAGKSRFINVIISRETEKKVCD